KRVRHREDLSVEELADVARHCVHDGGPDTARNAYFLEPLERRERARTHGEHRGDHAAIRRAARRPGLVERALQITRDVVPIKAFGETAIGPLACDRGVAVLAAAGVLAAEKEGLRSGSAPRDALGPRAP